MVSHISLIEVNDRLKSTCGEMEVKFVDNDTNFTFRNGTVDFATLNRNGIYIYPRAALDD